VVNLRFLDSARGADDGIGHQPLSALAWCHPVLFATGLTLIVGEPARVLKSPVFLLKMDCGRLRASPLVCQIPLQREADFWNLKKWRRRALWFLAAASLSMWAAIISQAAGRYVTGE